MNLRGGPAPWMPSAAVGGLVRRGRAVHLAGTSAGLDACVGPEAVDSRVPLLPTSVADAATVPVEACPPDLLATLPWYAPVPAPVTFGLRVVVGAGAAAATGLVVHPSTELHVIGPEGEREFVHQFVIELDSDAEPPRGSVGWVAELGTARPAGMVLAIRGRMLAATYLVDVLDALGATLFGGPDLPPTATAPAGARAVRAPLRPALPVVGRSLAELRRTCTEAEAADGGRRPRIVARRLSP